MCPNTEFFLVHIQSECGKMRTRKNSVFGHFSRSVWLKKLKMVNKVLPYAFKETSMILPRNVGAISTNSFYYIGTARYLSK